jgi:hypothetical protein
LTCVSCILSLRASASSRLVFFSIQMRGVGVNRRPMRRKKTSEETHQLPPVVDTQIISRRVILMGVTECGLHQTVWSIHAVKNLVPNTIGDLILNIIDTSNCLVHAQNQLCYLWSGDVTLDMSSGLIVAYSLLSGFCAVITARIAEKLHGYYWQ